MRSTSDALSVSLEAELKQRISYSQDFVLGRGAKSELELLIAQPPKVKKLSNNTQVSYTVNFVTQQSVLSASSGSCWQDQISECAEQILRDAKLNLRSN
ncbi:MAG: hypothetical protein EOO53_10445 [Gammaproteobacteria bacterium]|nr:MAG: hypothetical protein EOO53_10445 [Gammaproteobacteria bacterium]